MTKREIGCYPDENGETYVTFEIGTKGVPLKNLIPPKDRGEAFGDFRVADFFVLAKLVLVSPKDYSKATQDVTKKANSSGQSIELPLSLDLDYLRLRQTDGTMDPERTATLFEVVQAYWTAPQNTMALEPGLVAGLWRRGMSAPDIIKYIHDYTGPDGKLTKIGGRDHDIIMTVIDTFLALQGRPTDDEISQEELNAVFQRWMASTRSVSLESPEAKNTALHWADYRQLGLINKAGSPDLECVKTLAEQEFRAGDAMTFVDAIAWADKQKRKQGRVNRKRGRR